VEFVETQEAGVKPLAEQGVVSGMLVVGKHLGARFLKRSLQP
jgi:hypothetical protein